MLTLCTFGSYSMFVKFPELDVRTLTFSLALLTSRDVTDEVFVFRIRL